MKIPVIKTKDYTVYLEEDHGSLFIHCDCFKWNKTVKRQLKEDVDKLSKNSIKPIYAIHEVDDRKHLKFISMMGFKYHMDFIGLDNKMRQLFVRNHQNGN